MTVAENRDAESGASAPLTRKTLPATPLSHYPTLRAITTQPTKINPEGVRSGASRQRGNGNRIGANDRSTRDTDVARGGPDAASSGASAQSAGAGPARRIPAESC